MKKILALLVLGILALNLQGQSLRKFSTDYPGFLTDLETYLTQYDKKEGEEAFLAFKTSFEGGKFEDTVKQQLIITANALLKKRYNAFPDFNNFLKLSVKSTDVLGQEGALSLLKGIELIVLDNPTGKSKKFVSNCYEIVEHGAISKTSSSEWVVRNAIVSFTPDEKNPFFGFEEGDLVCTSLKDSLQIWETNGVFYPMDEKFVGNGGTVYWDRANFERDSAYAILKNYEVNTGKNLYSADSVELHSLYYVDKVLTGKLEDKLTGNKQGADAIYPDFLSYDKKVRLNIAEGVHYMGGFRMQGARFRGYGNSESTANIYFEHEGKTLIRCTATSFVLRENRVSSSAAAAYIYLEEDSIFHPKLIMRFNLNDRQLVLKREEDGLSQTPLFNTYHMVDMYFLELTWIMGQPKIVINNGKNNTTTKPVTFESADYFTLDKYEALQGMDPVHPMYRIAKIVRQADNDREFPINYIAERLKMTESQAKMLMMNMSILGFADYNQETDEVLITDRLFDFLEMKRGDRDYDVIQFVSLISTGENSTLSLLDYSMEMKGVGRILLSDSQDVFIFPKNQELTLKKNRDFDFSGQVKAGRFDFYGADFHFNYENFFLNLNQIDSMRFKVPSFTADENGNFPLRQVRTPLRDLSGVLYIDKMFNKSGKESFTEYPIFKSGKETFVYYDYKNIQKGAYKKEDFYFKVDPFELDSLDNFDTETLVFDGMFTSAGIFPQMRQQLSVQRDYSLGFEMKLPPEGLSAYGGKGKFSNELKLSNDGLIGDGVIEYLTSTAESKAFTFLPDSTVGLAQAFNVNPVQSGVEYPEVLGKDDNILWLPYEDKLHSGHTSTPFEIFAAKYTHFGELTVTPQGLLGAGMLKFESAETESQDYVFGHNSFTSDRTAFRLDRVDDGLWTIKITNALARVDFDQRKGKFTLNEQDDYISFPLNEYICYMDEIDWDMDKRIIDVRNTAGDQNSPMVSTKESQDSLRFVAGRARYVMADYFLEAFDVEHIDVADASIYPDDKYVAIEKFAKMRNIPKAKIVANRFDQYHKIYEAEANIFSRHNYRASGRLDYKDNRSKVYTITLDTIGVDSGTTFAYGDISANDQFFLSPFFAYHGKASMRGDQKYLYMDGKTFIQSRCNNVLTSWIPYHGEADPQDIYVDLSLMGKMPKGDTLYTGLIWAQDSAVIYSTLLGKLRSDRDNPLFLSSGLLWYDETANMYKVADRSIKEDPDAVGQVLALNTKNCNVEVEGVFDFNERMGQVSLDPIGNAEFKSRTGDLKLELTMAMDFFFSDDAMKVMTNDFYNEPMLGGIDPENPTYAMAVRHWVPKSKDAEKYLEDLSIYGSVKKLPKSLERRMILTELNMKFDEEINAFVSEKDFGIASTGDMQVNLLVNGKVVLERGRSDDELFVYLEANPSTNWYYFHYKRNRMEAIAANSEFDRILKELSNKKRSQKMKGQSTYYYMLATSKRSLTRILDR